MSHSRPALLCVIAVVSFLAAAAAARHGLIGERLGLALQGATTFAVFAALGNLGVRSRRRALFVPGLLLFLGLVATAFPVASGREAFLRLGLLWASSLGYLVWWLRAEGSEETAEFESSDGGDRREESAR